MNEIAEITNDTNAFWMELTRKMRKKKHIDRLKGGPGSGHHNHTGRPGKRGGSLPGKGGASAGQREPEAQSTASERIPGSVPTKRNELGQPIEEQKLHDLLAQGLPGVSHYVETNEAQISEHKWRYSTGQTRADTVRNATKELAEDSGVSEEVIGDMIVQWGETSNDGDMRSLAIQQAASAEFGVPMSEWQKTSIQRVEERKAKASADVLADDKRFTVIAPQDQQRAVLRTMYNNTQQRLAAEGYKPDDKVILYRGFSPRNSSSDDSYSLGEHINYQGNAIESWSVSKTSADGFGHGGITLAMEVPIRNIVSTARSGFGTLWEGEFVVMGSIEGQVVEVVKN